jgi:hypothetical protein
MTGSRIIFTEPASQDGVDMVFSDELRASIDQAMESNCDNIDHVCFESIKGLMFNQKTQLEARQLNGPELALVAIPLVVLLIPMIHHGAGQTQALSQLPGATSALHIPATQLGSAGSALQASTFAFLTNSASSAVTITPTSNTGPTVTQ